MQTNKILSASLIDIVFDGHNKEYGAYELRKNYAKRINRALMVTLTAAAMICGSVILASTTRKSRVFNRVGPEVELARIEEKKIEPLPEPERPREVKPVKTEIFTPPVVKIDDDIERPTPPLEDLKDALIGLDKIKGPADDGIPKPEMIDDKKGIVDPPKQIVSDDPVTFVEIDAKFSGNWVAFLERNLDPNVPVRHDAPAGRYSVVIQFVVDREGVVSDIRPLTAHGYGMEEEAVRVLKKAAKWEPAIQNGMKVKAYRKQVIVFVVNEE